MTITGTALVKLKTHKSSLFPPKALNCFLGFQCSTRPDVFHKKNVKQTASAWIWIPPIAKFGEKSALELKTIL